jgi:hypothetical protein
MSVIAMAAEGDHSFAYFVVNHCFFISMIAPKKLCHVLLLVLFA